MWTPLVYLFQMREEISHFVQYSHVKVRQTQLFVRIWDELVLGKVRAEWLASYIIFLAVFHVLTSCQFFFYCDVNVCLPLTEGRYKATLIH